MQDFDHQQLEFGLATAFTLNRSVTSLVVAIKPGLVVVLDAWRKTCSVTRCSTAVPCAFNNDLPRWGFPKIGGPNRVP